jgi:hypothetical protein
VETVGEVVRSHCSALGIKALHEASTHHLQGSLDVAVSAEVLEMLEDPYHLAVEVLDLVENSA